jgi:replication-associated recombination protein RarA
MLEKHSNRGNLLAKYRPRNLADVIGQAETLKGLKALVAALRDGSEDRAVLVFHGPTGVGKTCAAESFAAELGCELDSDELGGVFQIASGKQDGRSVEELLRSLRFRPLAGSGWRVAIVNEADKMTDQAEAIWLDGLEKHLPPRCVVIFTTNDLYRLTDRLIRRCEIYPFTGTGDAFRRALVRHVRKIWRAETGRKLGKVPEGLGRFELGSHEYSVALALQQIAPYVRRGGGLPDGFGVPIVREVRNGTSVNGSAAARKAVETRRRNAAARNGKGVLNV